MMMKQHSKIWLILLIFILFCGIAYLIYSFFQPSSPTQTPPPGATQISTDVNYVDTGEQENRMKNLLENRQSTTQSATTEETIAIFETTIGDDAPGRVKNIELTCSLLNETVLQPGEVFSFNQVVGEPTVERGYQEAKIIVDHQTTTGIGGGNCQVSSTLYNTVLQIPSLAIIERHEHGKDVYYVPDGKDAAVSYGGLDFKFRNDTGKVIKIGAITNGKPITTSIIQID